MWQGGPVDAHGACASPARGDGAPHRCSGRPSSSPSTAAASEERPQSALGPSVVGGVATAQPFTYVPAQRAAYERAPRRPQPRALRQEPGGVVALGRSARRAGGRSSTASPRATGSTPTCSRRSSCSRAPGAPTRAASDDLRSAAGLTQILAETGQNLLGHARRRQGRRARSRAASCAGAGVRQREALRRRVDERFDPAKALAATARYLRLAKGKLGREDLAVVSYHMGIGNLQQALTAYGKGNVPYAQLYFDSSPLRHAAAWRKLASLGDDSSTYLWRVLAAARDHAPVPQRPGRARARGRAAVAQGLGRGGPAPARAHDGVRRPLRGRPRAGIGRAARDRRARSLARYGLRIDPRMGELARRVDQSPRLYRALRPRRSRCCEAIGAGDAGDRRHASRWW